MTDPYLRAGAILAATIRLGADLAIITIAVILALSAAGTITLH